MPSSTTRNSIIEKADALFYESGFEATSFADIAAALGISRGNFYHHFKTKDEILDAVIAHRMERTRCMSQGPHDRILSFISIVITNRTKIMAFGCPVGTGGSKVRAAVLPVRPIFSYLLRFQFWPIGDQK